MERLMIQGKVEGTRLRGRSQMRWIDQITKRTGQTVHTLTTEALDRDLWKEVDNEFAVATTVPQGSTDWGGGGGGITLYPLQESFLSVEWVKGVIIRYEVENGEE
jgi:hypothetical protein